MLDRLKAIKANLEHTRRFQLHPNDWRSALTQAEGDIEELLIDYGFQKSEDRDALNDSGTFFVIQGLYGSLSKPDREWKDWSGREGHPTLAKAQTQLKYLGKPAGTGERTSPTAWRIVRRFVIEEVVDATPR